MPEPTMKPGPPLNDKPDPNAPAAVEGPPEEEFWERYNQRLEFPLATVSAILVHVLIAAILVVVYAVLIKPEKKDLPPLKIKEVGGLDDFGTGSAGSGGVDDPIADNDGAQMKKAVESLQDPSKLPEVRENLQQTIKLIDPTGNLPISDSNAVAYGQLDEAVRNKLLGARQGAGKEPGRGFDGSKGKGPGGTGSDATFARSMRWSLWFNVAGGHDYVSQLRAMGAKILVPVPPDNKQCVLIDDLNNPTKHRVAGLAELGDYSGLMQFSEARRGEVREVAAALRLDFTPVAFFAVFSKELEAELARMEIAYNNLRPDDIAKTAFEVKVIGNDVQIKVREQKRK